MKLELQKQKTVELKKSIFNRIPSKFLDYIEINSKAILIGIFVLTLFLTSCHKDEIFVTPSGEVSTRTVSFTAFTELDISSAFNVYLSFSETEESVQIESNSNVHGIIEATQSGDKLKVGLKKDSRIQGDVVLNLYITTSQIEEIKAAGACYIEFENSFSGDVLDVDLSGACKLIGDINTKELFTNLVGASEMQLTGNADYFEIDATGGSKMTGFNFTTNTLFADLLGGSHASMSIEQKLDATLDGASKLYYKGNGIIEKQNVTGGSEIIKMN